MSFSSESTIASARKQHICDVCAKPIEQGQPYVRWSGMSDGEFASIPYHVECRAAEIALNAFYGTVADDWIGLRYGREAADDDWLRAEWPLVAERMGIRRPKP